MDSKDPDHLEARDHTDASLHAERDKTDAELAKRQAAVSADADAVVEVARERAHEVLGVAREQADHDLAAIGASPREKRLVSNLRAGADRALDDERAGAQETLRVERAAHRRALSALLRLEREATDEGLVMERARADEVIANRDDFLGMVSHDLRGILGTIAMAASMLRRPTGINGSVDPAILRIGERIERGTARMSRLVGDLLDVVALDAGALQLALEPLDAVELITEAVEAYRPSFVEKGVQLGTEPPARAIVINLDHDRILQVVANLLSNALKFTEPGGRVSLLVVHQGADVRFSISDSGAGIAPEHATAVFERFGQIKRDHRGHGLGLYISKCIVEAHGGAIWVDRSVDGGTVVHFTLPYATT
ncbi:MAG: HAMP domain-containing histidine kinase [Deltaproteobacteria bacterium]|nr:HAMP domain-containing histidine kinase [Deltaproteobacteria bacterium]MDQ3298339.1 HAMP domain-containing histidine kinase [Myxococcota bacterium]